MKLYLAGPMRGIPEFNFPAFREYAAKLREQGHEIFSPAENDIKRHGKDISTGNVAGDVAAAATQHGFDLRTALAEDLAFICKEADGIAMMPGWGNSLGATAEHATARALHLEVLYL